MTRRRTGFTLLELMLALTMAATIAGSLAASLYVAYRARNSVDAAIDAAHANDAVNDIVCRDLANAVQPNGILASTFLGDATSLQFCCTGGETHGTVPGDLKQVQFSVTDDPSDSSSSVLVRSVTSNLLAPVQPVPVDEVICRNVQSFALSYYDGANWTDTWDSTQQNNTLPVAVEMVITYSSPGNPDDVHQIDHQIALSCGVVATGGTP